MCKFSSKSGGVPFQPLGDLTWNDPIAKIFSTPNILYYIVEIVATFQFDCFSKFLIIVTIISAHFAKLS